jgi:hypothetical protein
MAGKKPLSPASFRKKVEKHIKGQRSLLKGKKASANAKGRTKHYTKGDKLVKQVAATLNKIAASHPNPNAKKQAKLAIRKLSDAETAFGSACMCQSDVWNSDSK